MPQKATEKKEVLQNAEKKKLVPGFLHSVNHTGSPQDKSDIHSYFIPGQNNKTSNRHSKVILKYKSTVLFITIWKDLHDYSDTKFIMIGALEDKL